MYEMVSMAEINSLDKESVIIDAIGYHYKLHDDGNWRHCDKYGRDKSNKSPVSALHFRFPVKCYSDKDYSLEEKVFLLELRVEKLEKEKNAISRNL